MTLKENFHWVNWPAPSQVKAVISHRGNNAVHAENAPFAPGDDRGFAACAEHPSGANYGPNNLALHVGDKRARVEANRARLATDLGVEHWQWLRQVHGVDILEAKVGGIEMCADGSFTAASGLALAVLTADCLPILLCDQGGSEVAAIHAGWRGLAAGIVARAVKTFKASPSGLMAYIGPAIGPGRYEVDTPLFAAFQLAPAFQGLEVERFFEPVQHRPGHYMAGLAGLARAQLNALGVDGVYGGDVCTFDQAATYYSYRKHAVTGRFASVIWRQ